ncbi:MAG TPA: ISKra4 family transposase [Vicinamibacteria bacterium]|nr:ISKra4 family transposase [Vicinamibacteria bacterium]
MESCEGAFGSSRARFETVVAWLEGAEAAGVSHAELEQRLEQDSRRLFRQLLQDHLDLRAQREVRLREVVDAGGTARGSAEAGHTRGLATVFGAVTIQRIAYRERGHANLHPADGVLNLPAERHSHGLRRLAALESACGSFEQAVEAAERATGQRLGKRQVQDLAQRAAVDVEGFYAQRQPGPSPPGDVLVVSCDGKGVVMRPEALREPTRKQAGNTSHKLAARLSKGEKRNRKRMAEVGCVYDATPRPRTSADILPAGDRPGTPGPAARGKWLTASVTADAADVIAAVFDEATRRDPGHRRAWVALVDGNTHQIERIGAQARAREVNVTVVVDFIHVLEYLWKAAWCFFAEGDRAAEAWVAGHAQAVLAGHASRVAGAIRRKATYHGLSPGQRKNADTAATYLRNKRRYLDYPAALGHGWPIATGVIKGACRHLVKDRMDLTGARWGLCGAEAILKLRALHSNGDFEAYWAYHLAQEKRRTHQARYANGAIPLAA